MLTDKQKQALHEIGADTVCRIVLRSRHFDLGCYVLEKNQQISAHAVVGLIKKGFLEMLSKAPEKNPPPHSMYYRRTKQKYSEEYDNKKGFTCWCGHHAEPSGYVAAHPYDELKLTCQGCGKEWSLEGGVIEEK